MRFYLFILMILSGCMTSQGFEVSCSKGIVTVVNHGTPVSILCTEANGALELTPKINGLCDDSQSAILILDTEEYFNFHELTGHCEVCFYYRPARDLRLPMVDASLSIKYGESNQIDEMFNCMTIYMFTKGEQVHQSHYINTNGRVIRLRRAW